MIYITQPNRTMSPEFAQRSNVAELINTATQYGIIDPEKQQPATGEEETIERIHCAVIAAQYCSERGIPYTMMDWDHVNANDIDGQSLIGPVASNNDGERFVTSNSNNNQRDIYFIEADPCIREYHNCETFMRHSQRPVYPATMVTSDEIVRSQSSEQLVDVETVLHRLGDPDEVFIKNSNSKGLTFTTKGDAQTIRTLCGGYYPKAAHTHLIQPVCNIHHEYRFFVVNHTVITGAGRVISHSSLDNTEQFNPLTTKYASTSEQPDDLIDSRELMTEGYLPLARQFAREFAVEQPATHAYCLDIGLINGTPGVIELNSISNAGTYASDMKRLVTALMDHPVTLRAEKIMKL